MGDDRMTCESCEADFPIEEIESCGDVALCPACLAAWQAEFAACQHDWEPHHYDGEPGRYCRRCCGFVAEEDFADLFGALEGEHAREGRG